MPPVSWPTASNLLTLPEQLLRLLQSLRLLLLGGEIAADCVDQIATRHGRPGDPPVIAVLVPVAVVEPGERGTLRQAAGGLPGPLQIVRMDEIEQIAAHQVFFGPRLQR